MQVQWRPFLHYLPALIATYWAVGFHRSTDHAGITVLQGIIDWSFSKLFIGCSQVADELSQFIGLHNALFVVMHDECRALFAAERLTSQLYHIVKRTGLEPNTVQIRRKREQVQEKDHIRHTKYRLS